MDAIVMAALIATGVDRNQILQAARLADRVRLAGKYERMMGMMDSGQGRPGWAKDRVEEVTREDEGPRRTKF